MAFPLGILGAMIASCYLVSRQMIARLCKPVALASWAELSGYADMMIHTVPSFASEFSDSLVTLTWGIGVVLEKS